MSSDEVEEVKARYARRPSGDLYSMLRPDVWMASQERQRAILKMLRRYSHKSIGELKVLEIGCGSGRNLTELIQIGLQPDNLSGNELLTDRAIQARRNLPQSVTISEGDASTLEYGAGGLDIVYVSLVFSSILDDRFQESLADRIWGWVKPGGAVLWYDFVYDNPSNPDVRGVPVRRLKRLFPAGRFDLMRVTLAPPIARRVAMLHPALYTVCNAFRLLRTHVLCWIEKS